MALIVNTAPATEPVTRAEAALFMRYTGSLQNDVIDSLISSARQYVELWTGRTLVTTTYDFYTNQLYDVIKIPTSNIISVSAITYQDLDDAEQTLATTYYGVDNKSVINTIYLKPNQTYPEVLDRPNSVKITFTAGYGAASAVPENIKTAIKMMVAAVFENRESLTMQELKQNPAICQLLSIESRYQGW